jgi:antitoxin component of MazEF toxin-antitoxin module
MTREYHGQMKASQHGGSIRVTIPADAVADLDIAAGDYIGVYVVDGELRFVPGDPDD